MNHKKWRQVAQENYEELQEVNPDKATKNQFIMYASCVALLDRKEDGEASFPAQPETTLTALAEPTQHARPSSLIESLSEELSDAEKYLRLWRETGIPDYKQMSHDELHHYELLVKIARMSDPHVDLGQTMIWHYTLLAKLPENDLVDHVGNSLIDEKKQESLRYFVEYMKEKSLEQTTRAATHGEYAEEALRRMLQTDEEIATMLFNSADQQERQLITASYQCIAEGLVCYSQS